MTGLAVHIAQGAAYGLAAAGPATQQCVWITEAKGSPSSSIHRVATRVLPRTQDDAEGRQMRRTDWMMGSSSGPIIQYGEEEARGVGLAPEEAPA